MAKIRSSSLFLKEATKSENFGTSFLAKIQVKTNIIIALIKKYDVSKSEAFFCNKGKIAIIGNTAKSWTRRIPDIISPESVSESPFSPNIFTTIAVEEREKADAKTIEVFRSNLKTKLETIKIL